MFIPMPEAPLGLQQLRRAAKQLLEMRKYSKLSWFWVGVPEVLRLNVYELPGFVREDHYRGIQCEHPDEIGVVERFRLFTVRGDFANMHRVPVQMRVGEDGEIATFEVLNPEP